MKNKYYHSLMLFIPSIVWGLCFSLQNYLAVLGSYTVVVAMSGVGVFALIYAICAKRKFDKDTILGGILAGFFGALAMFFQQKGFELTTLSEAGFISSLYILFIPIIELVFKKKPKPIFWISVFIAIVGLYLLSNNDSSFSLDIGSIFALLAAFIYAVQIKIITRYCVNDVICFSAIQQTTATIVMTIPMLIIDKPSFIMIKQYIIPLIVLSLASGFVAQFIQNKYQPKVDITVASLILSLESIFGSIGGVIFLNEILSRKEIIGCLLLFIAVVISEIFNN